jgi:hypothetical protein
MQRFFAVLYRTELFLSSVYIQVVMDGTEPADNKEVILWIGWFFHFFGKEICRKRGGIEL